MKNAICTILSSALIIGMPILFAINGYGYTYWEYWAVLVSVTAAYIIGMLRMVDFE